MIRPSQACNDPAPAHLFVYGSLRAGARCPAEIRRTLEATSAPLGPAWTDGRLYRVAWYPGLVLTAGRPVRGDMRRIDDPDRLWPCLDAYEGPSFDCRVIEIRPESGFPTRAWCYVLNTPPAGAVMEPVLSGDWLSAEMS